MSLPQALVNHYTHAAAAARQQPGGTDAQITGHQLPLEHSDKALLLPEARLFVEVEQLEPLSVTASHHQPQRWGAAVLQYRSDPPPLGPAFATPTPTSAKGHTGIQTGPVDHTSCKLQGCKPDGCGC